MPILMMSNKDAEDAENLTRTPLLSTRRKVDSQGWQSKEGREEGGNRTCHVFIIISQILWTALVAGIQAR